MGIDRGERFGRRAGILISVIATFDLCAMLGCCFERGFVAEPKPREYKIVREVNVEFKRTYDEYEVIYEERK